MKSFRRVVGEEKERTRETDLVAGFGRERKESGRCRQRIYEVGIGWDPVLVWRASGPFSEASVGRAERKGRKSFSGKTVLVSPLFRPLVRSRSAVDPLSPRRPRKTLPDPHQMHGQ
jgi:hypothetical protein